MTYHQQKKHGYGHVNVLKINFKILRFVVMQRVARVCQRQLSYLSPCDLMLCALDYKLAIISLAF